LRNDEPDEEGEKPEDANMIFGTYISKDSSIKPAGVTKMLKVNNFALPPLNSNVLTVIVFVFPRDPNLD